ncbi:MAG: OmpA family protein [Pseudomonadota bacterium]
MVETTQETYSAQVDHTRRYVRRRGGPGLAFIPYGLIPALGLALVTLFALIPFASNWIESNAEQAALSSLRADGEGWADVSASGQWVTLTGEAPSAERAAKAADLVRAARAPTLFGRARPVTRVIDRTTLAGAVAPQTDPANPAETEPGTSPPVGETVTPAPSATEERARIAACDRSLRALLLESKIEFATGSARIADGSAGLLNQLSRAVTGCDLRVTIEGHTDSTGSSALNDRLSLARAQAVRDALVIRGVTPALLSAEGYGSARPIAGNDTAEGRDQNRRIEFVVRSSTEAQE